MRTLLDHAGMILLGIICILILFLSSGCQFNMSLTREIPPEKEKDSPKESTQLSQRELPNENFIVTKYPDPRRMF